MGDVLVPTPTVKVVPFEIAEFADATMYSTTSTAYVTVITFTLTPPTGKAIRTVGITLGCELYTASAGVAVLARLLITAIGGTCEVSSDLAAWTAKKGNSGNVMGYEIDQSITIEVQLRVTGVTTGYIRNTKVTVLYQEG